ncbi:expressed unknown protein [Seminavis robusta]|uniref:Uncharacterized protein n=1 Tax=Seminavis robusta TaxID=568900 RepID=A0A9N8HNX3_9STRA|nr:expressed unknown protein [Seminavis robusta]|eukprot:Sro1125_g243890.1 n/a (157) ;mRNA; f:11093-11563
MPSKRVLVQFDFDDSESFIQDGLEQISERRRNGKRGRKGAEVNDQSLLVDKLKGASDKAELVRVHCYSGFETSLMAIRAIYRFYKEDGTVREFPGDKHFFEKGRLCFQKKDAGNEDESHQTSKLSFERNGIYMKAKSQEGARGMVSPSLRVCYLRC